MSSLSGSLYRALTESAFSDVTELLMGTTSKLRSFDELDLDPGV